MKVNKTQALMFILMMLMKNKSFSKSEIMNQIDISDLSFRRYMQELRAFLVNFNYGYELQYSKTEEKYFLVCI